jgi:hypothetical protein
MSFCRAATLIWDFSKMLKPGPTSSYAHHTEGTANLIRHRSPSSFSTPYEQALFLAHIGPAFSEAFYRAEPCYLAEPEWIELYTSLAEETDNLTDRSPLVIRIRKADVFASGLFVGTSQALSAEGQSDPDFLLALELKIRAIHHQLLRCLEEYNVHMIRTASTSSQGSRSIVEQGAYGTCLTCLCVYKRMLAALCEDDRLRLEAECQALVVLIRQAHEQTSARHSWLHTEAEYSVAFIMRRTGPSWAEDLRGETLAEQRLASRNRWEVFRGYASQYLYTAGKGLSERANTLPVTLPGRPKQRWT